MLWVRDHLKYLPPYFMHTKQTGTGNCQNRLHVFYLRKWTSSLVMLVYILPFQLVYSTGDSLWFSLYTVRPFKNQNRTMKLSLNNPGTKEGPKIKLIKNQSRVLNTLNSHWHYCLHVDIYEVFQKNDLNNWSLVHL